MGKSLKQFAVILFFLSNLSNAQPVVWSEKNVELNIGNRIEILEDPTGDLSFKDIQEPETQGNFKKWEKPIITLGYTESFFWIKFKIDNPTTQKLMLEVGQAGLPDCDLYSQISPDSTLIFKAGANTKFHNRIEKSSFQVFPLPAGSHEYYLRLTSNSGPIPLKLYNEREYDEKSLSQKFVYGIYLGLMLFVFLSNLFFFLSLKNFLYAVNSINVLLFTCYSMAVVDGFVVYFFSQVDIIFWYTTIPPLGMIVQTVYSLWFLEVKKYRPKLYKSILVVIGVYVFWFVLKFFLSFPIVQPINTLQALFSFFLMGLIGIRVGQKGNKFGYYFALTYFVYFLMVLAEATYINTGEPEYILGFSYSGYATIIEAFALSFLLTKRFEWEKKELVLAKLEAQALLVKKTQENERIVKEQNVILEQKVNERTRELTEEKQKSDNLLHNILPQEVVEELKDKGISEAKQFENVSVLFTDFVSFIQTAEKFSAKELVQELNDCFKEFDNIITRYNLEKIKTIGDSYMVAGGLEASKKGLIHKSLVLAGLEMQQFMKSRFVDRTRQNLPAFRMRIGVHSGSVVAGIVGVKKFQYDIWGNTVNTASRMESYGEPGEVNISHNTYELIKDDPDFTFEWRGEKDVKGKGMMEMWFVRRA